MNKGIIAGLDKKLISLGFKSKIKNIKSINSRRDSQVLMVKFKNGESVYLKKFSKGVIQKIDFWKRISENFESMPKICGVVGDFVVFETIKGSRLSNILMFYSLPLHKKHFLELCSISRKIGEIIANFQISTQENTKKFNPKNSLWDFNLRGISKIAQKVGCLLNEIDKLKQKKFLFCGLHGDFVPFNIFVNNDGIKIIDFSYKFGFDFEDPITFSVALELTQRLPWFSKKMFLELDKEFWKGYLKDNKKEWKEDEKIYKTLRYIRYYNLYQVFSNRKIKEYIFRNLSYVFPAMTDKKILLNYLNSSSLQKEENLSGSSLI